GGRVVLNEGDTLQTGGHFSQPGAGGWTATVDYGGGAEPLALNPDHTFRLEHLYPRFGSHTVTVTVRAQDGGGGVGSAPVVVTAVPPLVRVVGPVTIFEGETFTTPGSFQDPGADAWTAAVDYGDGSGAQPLALSPGSHRFGLQRHFADN